MAGEGGKSGIGPKIGISAVPSTIRENVGAGQSSRAAACDITQRSNLQRLVVVLAPLVIVDRGGRRRRTAVYCIVSISVGNTGLLGEGVTASVNARMMTVRIPVQPPAGPDETPVQGLPRPGVAVDTQ